MTATSPEADLLTGRTFRVGSLEGLPALETPTAEITFGVDGRLTGSATVNRINGTYRLEHGVLLCGPLASTMMAGPPDAMDQERRVCALLAGAPTVRAGAEGGIELVDRDALVSVLRPVSGEEMML